MPAPAASAYSGVTPSAGANAQSGQSDANNSTAGRTNRPDSSGTYAYGSSNSDKSTLKHGDRHFLTTVAKSSEREVAIAQLAAQKASNPQVRSYAQHLVSEHEQMNRDLVQLAQQKGVQLKDAAALESTTGTAGTSPSASASASGTAGNASSSAYASTDTESAATSDRHYRSLEKKSGADFDKEFVSMMVADHKKDVKLFEKEASEAKDPDVKAFASQHVAALQAHLDQANNLTRSAAE